MPQTEYGGRILDHIPRGEESWRPRLCHRPERAIFPHRLRGGLGGIARDAGHGDVAAAADRRTRHTVIPHLYDDWSRRTCPR